MSVRPPSSGVGHRPVVTVAGAVMPPMLHLLDLARFLPVGGGQWTDAFVSETRRHLAGCLQSIETALVADLASRDLPAVCSIPHGHAWAGVQMMPHLVATPLMAHMRARAAVALLLRDGGSTSEGAAAPAVEDAGWLVDDADADIATASAELARAEQRWAMVGSEDRPMSPDLPAEHHADLVWTVAALTGNALCSTGAASTEAVFRGVAQAAMRMIAGHDADDAPMARAVSLARCLTTRPDAGDLLGMALGQRRLLMFSALAGERLEVPAATLAETLVHAGPDRLAGICHALGGSDADYRYLLLQLRPVRADFTDAAIVDHAGRYSEVGPAAAEREVTELRGPEPLRAKLALIDPAGRA